MTKFYVQSGTVRSIVQAESARKAALWAIHQTMGQVLPLDEPNGVGTGFPRRTESSSEVAVLSGKVTVSDHGFDSEPLSTLSTMQVVTEWNQMVMTLDRLERLLCRAT